MQLYWRSLSILLLLSLSNCATEFVYKELWEPGIMQGPQMEIGALEIKSVSVTKDGRFYMEAVVGRWLAGTNPQASSRQAQLYCFESTLAEIIRNGRDISPGTILAKKETLQAGEEYTTIPLNLNAGRPCMQKTKHATGQNHPGLESALNQLFIADLNIKIHMPEKMGGPHRMSGKLIPAEFRKQNLTAYTIERESLYLVHKESGDYLILKRDFFTRDWHIKTQGSDFKNSISNTDTLQILEQNEIKPGPILLIQLKNLIPDAKGIEDRHRKTTRQYAIVIEPRGPELMAAMQNRHNAVVVEILLKSEVAPEDSLQIDHLLLNTLAVPLFPVAVLIDIIAFPFVLGSACLSFSEGMDDAMGVVGEGAANEILGSCLK